MQKVNIYTATSAKGPSVRKKACFIYVIEYISEAGKVYTKVGRGILDNVTENQIELTCILRAFSRLVKPCEVTVYSTCRHIINSVSNYWVQQWAKNGWEKSLGNPVRNAELWQQYLNVTKNHLVSFSDEPHSYLRWECEELLRMKELEDGKVEEHHTAGH